MSTSTAAPSLPHPPLPWAAAVPILLLLTMTSLLTPSLTSPTSSPPWSSSALDEPSSSVRARKSPPAPAQLTEQAANMNVSNLGDALLLLSGVFISAVQPTPKVALQFIFPDVGLQKYKLGKFDLLFKEQKRKIGLGTSVEVEPVMTWTRSRNPGPGDVLQALCNDTFQDNVVTVLHINNPKVSRDFKDVSRYLTQLLDNVGLPVISWDSDFSTARQEDLTLQLAPTMYHQTEAMLAFMKKFSWKFFSMVTTSVVGSEDFFAALRNQQRISTRQSLPNKYGHIGFEYTILSEVVLKSGKDKEKIRLQLYEDLDPDTRIILLHCGTTEALYIMEVAQEMGLTGREYVWIMSASALGDRSEGDVASSALPLGLFAVTYESALQHMQPVIKRGISVWLQALQDMERDDKLNQWNWDTELSCVDRPLKRWSGGQLIYEYMRNVSLPPTKQNIATDFSENGMVTSNKISILNVMRKRESSFSTSSSSSSIRGSGGFRPSTRPGSSGGRGSSLFGGGGGGGVGGGSLGRFPSRNTGSSSGGSRIPSRGSSSTFGSRRPSGNRLGNRFPSRSNSSLRSSSSSRRRLGGSSNSLLSSSSSSSSDRSPLASSGGSLSGKRNLTRGFQPSWRKNTGARRIGGFSRSSLPSSPRRPTVSKDKGDSEDVDSTVSRSGLQTSGEEGSSDSTVSPDLLQDRRARHRKARRHLLRHHRLSRSLSQQKAFQKVATWDGTDLDLMEIVWPGNSSFPPKGVPERYHLDVATYIEEPHVTYKAMDKEGKCDLHATKCKVYKRDESDNRLPGEPKTEQCCSGLSIDILDRLSAELNFNYSLFEVESGGYGSYNHNTSQWSGLVRAVMKKEAEVAVAALSITPEREDVIDFTVPFLETGITIVVAIREGAISPTAFLEPYDYPSWTLILVFSVHAIGASIFIFEWLSPYGLDQGHIPLRVHKFSLFRSFWLIWAMLFGAAVSTDMPRGVSSRFLANIWALFAVVFLASYTANLAAFMITKEEYYDLSGIQDWRLKNPHHRHPPFKYATMPDGATETNIRKNHPDLYVHMKKYPQYTVKAAVAALKDQKIQAFIYDATTLEYAVGRDVGCKLKSVGKRYAETGYGIGFPKKSRWVKKFNKVLLRMQDEGEIERLQKFWLAGSCHKKQQTRGSSSHTLGILNFTSAFILLGGGVVLGALLLMLEHIYFRFGRKSLRKWDKCGCCSLVSLSMGQSLTFEQSVMEAIDMHKHHKCRDPLCETQLWKAKHELDIAMLKIDQLKRQLAKQTAEDGGEGDGGRRDGTEPPGAGNNNAVWTFDPDSTLHKDGVPRKRASRSSPPSVHREQQQPRAKEPLPSASPAQGTTTRIKAPAEEKSYSPYYSPSMQSEDDDSSPRHYAAPRRTRVNDGKIYENVDGGIDIESTI